MAEKEEESTTSRTGEWTRYLPEAFGIRKAIQDSPYRWCTRESALWGIATGCAMGLHRYRMGSRPIVIFNVSYATLFVVMLPTYYLCVRQRNFEESMIEHMMAENRMLPASMAPEPIPAEEDPFLSEKAPSDSDDTRVNYRAHFKEGTHFKKPIPSAQDPKDVFTRD